MVDEVTEKKLLFSGHYNLQSTGKYSFYVTLDKKQLKGKNKGDEIFIEVYESLKEEENE